MRSIELLSIGALVIKPPDYLPMSEAPIRVASAVLKAGSLYFLLVFGRIAVLGTVAAGVTMGLVAFLLLMGAEIAVGAWLFGRTPAGHFALYKDASYALGLATQVAFALMPVIQLRRWA
jgi:ABC-type polysaccharide/polyol phosphate export permease